MKKLLLGIARASAQVHTVEEWNAAVDQRFGRYIRRKSVLKRHRESLRSELMNLARLEVFPADADLLLRILRKYRAILRANAASAYNFLIECFEDTLRADERWMGLFITHAPPLKTLPLHDRVTHSFAVLDGVLEGSYKPHLRVLSGFAEKDQTGHFPLDITQRDFGSLFSFLPNAYSARAQFLIQDSEHSITVNQWRNIAAHRSFAVRTRSTIDIEYGRNRKLVKRITLASLVRAVDWAVRCVYIARMANLIIYLEYLPQLKESGLSDDVWIRLESGMVGLCHNLRLVGFEPNAYGGEGDVFVLSLTDRLNRETRNAIIHASQALDQISTILECDPTKVHRFKRVAVRLLDSTGAYLAQASVALADAIAFTLRTISMTQLIERTSFHFSGGTPVDQKPSSTAAHGTPVTG